MLKQASTGSAKHLNEADKKVLQLYSNYTLEVPMQNKVEVSDIKKVTAPSASKFNINQ